MNQNNAVIMDDAAETAALIAAAPKRAEPVQAEPSAMFDGAIEPATPSLARRIRLIGIAMLTLLVPLIYLAIVAGSIAYWARNAAAMLTAEKIAGADIVSGSLVLAAVLAAIVVLLKPLLVRRPDEPPATALQPSREPALFAYVSDICDRVGAPQPKEIRIDCETSVRARYRTGLGHLLGKDIVLTIGMPAAASLDQRQFSGAIAHELGHFADGATSRAGYVVFKINRWFFNVVHHPDVWDLRLDRAAHRFANAIGTGLTLLRWVAGAGRLILRVLASAAGALGNQALREMEFSADRFQAQLVGSDEFRTTAEKLILVREASDRLLAELADDGSQSGLPANLPRLVASRVGELAPQAAQIANDSMLQPRSWIFDDHAADYERVDFAEGLEAPGIMNGNGQTADLFADFASAAKESTAELYRHRFGKEPSAEELISDTQINRIITESQKTNSAFEKYFLGFFSVHHYLPPGDVVAAMKVPADARTEKIDDLCVEIRRGSPEAREVLTAYAAARQQLIDNAAQERRNTLGQRETHPQRQRQLRTALGQIHAELEDIQRRYCERLALGLAAALADAVLDDLEKAQAIRAEIGALLAAQTTLAGNRDTLLDIYVATAVAAAAEQVVEKEPKLADTDLEKDREQVRNHVESLRADLRAIRYPFAAEGGNTSVLRQLEEDAAELSDGTFLGSAYALLNCIEKFHTAVMVRLAEIALATELRHGIKLKLID